MNTGKKAFVTVLCSAVLLFSGLFSALAEVTLPDGAVAGLPENLTVLDSDGNAVDTENGEYFFTVDDMVPYEVYTKDIQIMNLRDDASYHIYFYAEPISQEGEIDLENDCTAVITLNGSQIYKGKVTGEGEHDLANAPIDLGLYKPGDSGQMTCQVTWDGPSADIFIDYGEKLVNTDGTTIIREGNDDHYIYGRVQFKWIFYAAVDTDAANTGILGKNGMNLYIIAILLLIIMVSVMLMLVLKKKKQRMRKAVK